MGIDLNKILSFLLGVILLLCARVIQCLSHLMGFCVISFPEVRSLIYGNDFVSYWWERIFYSRVFFYCTQHLSSAGDQTKNCGYMWQQARTKKIKEIKKISK